jgi:hypothetical protein
VCAELFGIRAPCAESKSAHYERLADWFAEHGCGLAALGLA